MTSRRDFLGFSTLTVACTAFGTVATELATGGFGKYAFAASANPTQLVLLGTQGGPNFNAIRRESGAAIVVDDNIYLIDCGYGVLGRLVDAGLPYLQIGQVFLSHLHDDHTADIPALVGHQWTQGRVTPTTFHGPHGMDAMIEAALAFNQANTDIRMIDEARSLNPRDVFRGIAVSATDSPQLIHEDEYVRVLSIENTHYPEENREHMPHRSLSFRFDTADRSIVFSGDTTYSDNLVDLARGADILVCETMNVPVMREVFEGMIASGNYQDGAEGIWHHIVTTHVTTEDAGRMAAAAGVGMLVMTHLIPGGLREIGDAGYIEGARAHFEGEIIVGRDLMFL